MNLAVSLIIKLAQQKQENKRKALGTAIEQILGGDKMKRNSKWISKTSPGIKFLKYDFSNP